MEIHQEGAFCIRFIVPIQSTRPAAGLFYRSSLLQQPLDDAQALVVAEKFLRGEHGGGGQLPGLPRGLTAVLLGRGSVLLLKGPLKILGAGKAAGEADVQQGPVGEEQLPPGYS